MCNSTIDFCMAFLDEHFWSIIMEIDDDSSSSSSSKESSTKYPPPKSLFP